MNNLVRSAASLALILVLANTASADPLLDFLGPPSSAAGLAPTSQFDGDWDEKTGELTLDDLVVDALEFIDGSFQALGLSSDTILGADVLIRASFDNGSVDTTDGFADFIRISDGSDIFYEATIFSGRLVERSGIYQFESAMSTDTSGSGLPKVNDVVSGNESDWIDENANTLMNYGANIEFWGKVLGQKGDITTLKNIQGKLEPVPEPGTLALFGAAAVGFIWVRRRKRA